MNYKEIEQIYKSELFKLLFQDFYSASEYCMRSIKIFEREVVSRINLRELICKYKYNEDIQFNLKDFGSEYSLNIHLKNEWYKPKTWGYYDPDKTQITIRKSISNGLITYQKVNYLPFIETLIHEFVHYYDFITLKHQLELWRKDFLVNNYFERLVEFKAHLIATFYILIQVNYLPNDEKQNWFDYLGIPEDQVWEIEHESISLTQFIINNSCLFRFFQNTSEELQFFWLSILERMNLKRSDIGNIFSKENLCLK